ncbi:MAG TPA: SIR2 family protein [Dehalococcoidales bacterium]
MSQIDRLPKACVVLGAGASADVWNGSAPILSRGNYKPPLARDLFAIEKHPSYFNILNLYLGAKSLAAVLSPKSETREFNLEDQLRKLAEHKDKRIHQQFKYIPPYLRDLLWHASYQYTHTPGTYIQLIHALLADKPHHVLFLVLNYDTLLEQALALFDPTIDFNEIHSYIGKERQAKVVKLHGSINWFKLIGTSSQPWETLVDSQDVFQKVKEDKIYLYNSGGPLMSILISGNRPYPILTAPLAGKGVADMVCPETHIQFAKEFLKGCEKFLIIGCSGLDNDLLALLDEAIPSEANPTIHLVGHEDGEKALARFEKGVTAFHGPRETPPDILFKNGFRQYVNANLNRFAEYPSGH